MSTETEPTSLASADIAKVMELLPHRYPFLMIDKIIEIDGKQSATGIKNVSINEPFFQGHFPGKPVMPGVLLIEAIAQTAGALVVHYLNKDDSVQLVYFMSIDKARFRKPVLPGDQVHFRVDLLQNRGNVWKYKGVASVDGGVVAQAEITAMIVDQ